MTYLWWDFETLKGGQIIEIDVATTVNLKLMSYDSFSSYRSGHPYRYYGGYAIGSPCHIKVPYDGPWILVADLSHPGIFQVKNVRVLPDKETVIFDSNKGSAKNKETTIDIVEKEAPSEELRDKIFIVHGHDNEMTENVNEFIQILDFQTIILRDQENKGRTIIEKLEDYANDIKFAIILYSPDDEMKDNKMRARQNVVFEHGLFIGKLSREKVAAICKSDVELFSDLSGVLYIKYEDNWNIEIAREMKAAGLSVDLNKLMDGKS
jgi:predicted nucleotide-binding protein